MLAIIFEREEDTPAGGAANFISKVGAVFLGLVRRQSRAAKKGVREECPTNTGFRFLCLAGSEMLAIIFEREEDTPAGGAANFISKAGAVFLAWCAVRAAPRKRAYAKECPTNTGFHFLCLAGWEISAIIFEGGEDTPAGAANAEEH